MALGGEGPVNSEQTSAPAVSVIVPVRNREKLLAEALSAISKQTFTDFEVVVVDDGSTDETFHVAADAARSDPRIRIVQGSGTGAVPARIHGVEQSVAPFLAFTDSDCVPAPNWLGAGVKALRDGADVAQGTTKPIGRVKAGHRSVSHNSSDGFYATCNVFYRREAYQRVGGFDVSASRRMGSRPGARAKSLGFGEDTLLGWRVRRDGVSAAVPDALVYHQVLASDLADAIGRAWVVGGLPTLLREVPEWRESLLRHGIVVGSTRRTWLVACVAAWALGFRGSAGVLAACWVGANAKALDPGDRRAEHLARQLLLDAVIEAALLVGSVRARVLIL